MQPTVALIVPCYNEASRLDADELVRLVRSRGLLDLVLVDDGSTDGTCASLDAVAARAPGRVRVLRMERNQGKAEAVRHGLLLALEGGARVVGYADADLSTPVDELLALVDEMERDPVDVLLGSRVRLLGRTIDRHAHRHYLGRVFATVASLALRMPVYDTQCGAKLLRVSETLVAALQAPFRSRWIFDVELLARLLDGAGGTRALTPGDMRERPLQVWRDVAGSKLRLRMALWAGLEVAWLLVRRRLAGAGPRPRAVVPPAEALPEATPAPDPEVRRVGLPRR